MLLKPYLSENVRGDSFQIGAFFALCGFLAVIGFWLWSARGMVSGFLKLVGIQSPPGVVSASAIPTPAGVSYLVNPTVAVTPTALVLVPTEDKILLQVNSTVEQIYKTATPGSGSSTSIENYVPGQNNGKNCQLVLIEQNPPDFVDFAQITVPMGTNGVIGGEGCEAFYFYSGAYYKGVLTSESFLDPNFVTLGYWMP